MKAMLVGAAAILTLGAAGAAQAGNVTVAASGVQARSGTLYAALQSRDQFMQPQVVRGTRRDNPTAGTVELVFEDVPPGDYAITILHDQNGNRRMDMNGIMPMEGYALVRGEALREQPTFDAVKITVPAAGARFTATMAYYDGRMPGEAARR